MSREKIKQTVASQESAVDESIDARMKELHTALPGLIVSFNSDVQTASVQALISRVAHDDSVKPLPVCVDVPVHFPGGGDYVLTFPVSEGDECLLVFSERAIDGWFESGEITPPADYRLHDLSDGFALVGFRSKPHKVTNFSGDAVELRALDGATKVMLKTGNVELITPSSHVKLNGDTCDIKAAGGITLDGPITLKGPITTLAGNGGTGEATFAGAITATEVTANGISLTGHTHDNPEGGNVGAPE